MGFSVRRDAQVEQVDAGFLVWLPGRHEVVHLTGTEAEAFALARRGSAEVPESLTAAMAGLVTLGVVETDVWSRRRVLQLGGAAAAATVAVVALPGIAAAASGPGDPTTTVESTTTVPVDSSPCVLFDWGNQTSNAPLSPTGTGRTSNVKLGDDGITTLTVTTTMVGTPAVTAAYRNFHVNTRPYSGAGSISGYGDNTTQPGLVLIQNNGLGVGTVNPDVGNITNYQEVTFTFSAPVTSLTFTVYDISATISQGASTNYMDAVGFSATPTVLNDTGVLRSVGGQLVGSGTFTDPFRRVLATDNYWGADPNDPDHNLPLDTTVRFTGPLTELKLRYSSIAGQSLQFIKIGDMQTGGGCTALPPGA